jgi:hypothetical protein
MSSNDLGFLLDCVFASVAASRAECARLLLLLLVVALCHSGGADIILPQQRRRGQFFEAASVRASSARPGIHTSEIKPGEKHSHSCEFTPFHSSQRRAITQMEQITA